VASAPALQRVYGSAAIEAALFFLLSIMAVSLLFFDRSDHVYRWLATVFLLTTISSVYTCIVAWTQLQSITMAAIITDVIVIPLILGLWVMVWWKWFRLQRPSWMPTLIAVLTVLYMVCDLLGENLFFNLIPPSVNAGFHMASLGTRILFMPVLIMIVVWGVREQGREGLLALPAVILAAVSQFQTELSVLHVRVMWFPFGGRISLAQISMLALAGVMLILLVRRLLFSLRRQKQMALDVKQAQEIQQVILPGAVTWFPGYAIESEYRPAREVGGDFFQILPDGVGGVLILLGDVTGKGLQAGMQVALIVGAIRTTVETSYEPHVVLESLNRRLCGRGQSYATCVAMHVSADGKTTISNAGHIAPYLNGKELAMAGNLPLGLNPSVTFDQETIQLKQKDRLLVITDGVIEAKNAKNELFGFNRARSISHLPAAFIVKAAEIFGQEDDITVVSISRLALEKEGEVSAAPPMKSEVA